ncbi:acyl carrier protein [Streptomyces flavofungini]|uniref:Acyl carrier protein n=1 Tax=Streptomyces flavofungini TaxID=68200 RepID=A0ABS0XJ95_9ACTN|nr:phosphopantetheine-binding protein [Streptomyces flavofungini]MBJ3813307.1 acyl carrier protein [Streptomyces flavofungini]GHC91276.1 acyl carrier protein [Streptomyces flavofungini]
MSNTLTRLVTLLAKGFGFETHEVAATQTFNDLELDSLALVELTLAIQSEFGIKLSDEELRANSTITQAVQLIDAKQEDSP